MGHSKNTRLSYFTEYAEQNDDNEVVTEVDSEDTEIVIPEDLSEMDQEALAGLHSSAVEAFNALYGENGSDLTDEGLDALSVLTQGIERVQTELDTRKEQQSERSEKASQLAAKAGIELGSKSEDDEDEGEVMASEDGETLASEESTEEESVTASGSKDIRINLTGLRSRSNSVPAESTPTESTGAPSSMKDVVKAAPEFAGFSAGQGLDWDDLSTGLDRRLASFNRSQWEQANAQGRHMRTQQALAVIQKPFTDDMRVKSDSLKHIDDILQHASKESRLPGNSLVAAGGWCAPSETVYDLCEIESRDGMFSAPEIGISRGGIQYTAGPNFTDIYANTGFHYTEAEDAAGDYDGAGGGSKPCYTVECPPFTETRLDYDGVCINAGLLMQRGYPEVIARTTRGALVAHDFRVAAGVLAAIEAGSTAVAMPAGQVGATAPVLTSIELQVEHFRSVNRVSRSQSLEAVFPFWVRGAIRSDLSRRLGVDLFDVSDARIDGWFSDRGVAAQFVYGLAGQDPTGGAETFTAWPTEVKFLLYAAGTWVKGGADIITIDTLYDSVLLGTNDYTALFTEEGWLVAKMCHDSRVVSVPLSADGAVHAGVDIAHDGSLVAAV